LKLISESSESVKSDKDNALKYFNQAIELLPKTSFQDDKKQSIRTDIYINIGIILKSQGLIDKAIISLKRALTIATNRRKVVLIFENDHDLAIAYRNLAFCSDEKRDYIQSLKVILRLMVVRRVCENIIKQNWRSRR
jgi:tetratricopeptide (TPR) repeat protein